MLLKILLAFVVFTVYGILDGVRAASITNGVVEVDIAVDAQGYLTETYSAVDAAHNSQQALIYNGPRISGTAFDDVFITWGDVKQLSATSISVTGTFQYQTDSDTPGGDLSSFSVNGYDPMACAKSCSKTANCHGWTFVKPGVQNTSGICWLKSKLGVQESSSCCYSGNAAQAVFVRTISLNSKNPNMVYVSHVAKTPVSMAFVSFDDWYNYAQFPVDFAYSPHIKHQDTDITPHWEFKSPTVMLQTGSVFAALIPDMDTITAGSIQSFPPNMDLKNDGNALASFSYTITNTYYSFHSLYSRNTAATVNWSSNSPFSCNYFLVISAQETPLLGYRLVSEFLWSQFGSPRLAASPSMQIGAFDKSLNLFDSWRADTWNRYAGQVYFEVPCGSETCGAMNSYRSGPGKDGWFNSWFQQLRTSYGWYLNGQRTNNLLQIQKARRVLTLALHAPAYNSSAGPFASIFYLAPDGSQHWQLDDSWAGLCRALPDPPADCSNFYHAFDMSWTGYWLSKWNELVNEPRILPIIRNYGDFLLRQQLENGLIPSYYHGETLRVAPEFSMVNAETAGSGLFLAQLYKATNNKAYLQAAIKTAKWMQANVMVTRMWYDFETFFSCTLKPIGFYDGFTRQWPENNLGKIQTAMLFHELWNITNDDSYLTVGVQALDYLLLTQQVVSHPLLTPNLLGGFTTQNTDSEWSDARQGYVASLLLDYYRATWRFEYLERGVAALRSSWAVAPYENWAHGGSGTQGALTGIHWCQGSGMTSIEMTYDWLRDAYINVAKNHTVGVNGCTLKNLVMDLSTSPARISFSIISNFVWPYNLVVAVEGLNKNVSVTANGQNIGIFGRSGPGSITYVQVPPKVI